MKKFVKNVEDFICENCGNNIKGNGYTNHCPNCLYSKHVDINPGDRACSCKGLMEPISILQKKGELVIIHKCLKCSFERKNKVLESDNRDKIIELMKKLIQKNIF